MPNFLLKVPGAACRHPRLRADRRPRRPAPGRLPVVLALFQGIESEELGQDDDNFAH